MLTDPDDARAAAVPEPGALLGRHALPEEFRPEGAAEAVGVLYRGVGYDGTRRAVSGSVFLPAAPPPPDGWPVVSYAHGTTGLSDRCAPSRAGLTRLEREHVSRWLAAGYVVAATDYEGLATPGPHPYFNGEAVADDVVDVVRAARRLDPRIGRTWLVAGFSQGGHAALFVGLLASRYAPELDFRGTVALAPPVHLPLLVDVLTARGEDPLCVLLPFLLAGLRTSHPGVDARAFLTTAGGDLVELAATAPLVEVFRAAAGLSNDDAGTTLLGARRDVAPVLRACRVPVARLDRPLLITAGTADEIVPVEVVERFVGDVRRAGTAVRFTRHDGATHAEVLGAGHDDVIAWTRELLADGVPAPEAGPRRFDLLDVTRDGYLTRDDHEAFALRLVQAFGEPPGSPAAVAVREGYRALWRGLTALADTDEDGRVDQAEFLRWLRPAARDGFDQEVRPLAEAVIALADADRDGVLSAAEFARLLHACDVPGERVPAVLRALDVDRSGSVSAAEVVAAIRGFCLAPALDEPGHWLFGRF